VTKCAAACDVTERIWRRWETGEPPACTRVRALVRVLKIENSEDLFLPPAP
jgi:hypothetical protein